MQTSLRSRVAWAGGSLDRNSSKIKIDTRRLGGFYRPPNSNNNYNNLIEESIDKAFNTNIANIFILGDFNYNLLHNNDNKMTEIIQEFNLKQLITEATHFTEHSSSLIGHGTQYY